MELAEGFYLGKTGEAVIGTKSGPIWDDTELEDIDAGMQKGWEVFVDNHGSWTQGDDPPKDLKFWWMRMGQETEEVQNDKVSRVRLRQEDFLHHGFTKG